MKQQEMKLSAYSRFQCLAEQCPMTCCQGLDIHVDPQTLQKWREFTDREESKRLLADTVHSESNGNASVNMRRQDDEFCIALSADGLCTIQVRHGHDLLPQNCRDYPRSVLESDTRRLESLQLSCPEAVRLVLFDDADSPLFDHGSQRAAGALSHFGYESTSLLLDEFVNTVLQSAKFPLNVKVLAISTALTQLAILKEQGRLDQSAIDGLFKKAAGKLYELNLAIKQGRIRPDPLTRGGYWRSIYRLALMKGASLIEPDLSDSKWHKLLSECTDSDEDIKKIDNAFETYWNSARAGLRDNYGKLLLRYFTVCLGNRGFPWKTSDLMRELTTFIHCVTKLSVIQLLCLIKQHETGSLENEFVYRLIYTVERKIDHLVPHSALEKDPEKLKLQLYQACFSDLI